MTLHYTAFRQITKAPTANDGVSGGAAVQCLSGFLDYAEVDNDESDALPAGTSIVLLTAVTNDQVIAWGDSPDASVTPNLYLVAGTSVPIAMQAGWTIDTDDAA